MRTVLVRLMIAAVLGAAAWLSRAESRFAAEVANARQAIVTFDYTDAGAWQPRASLTDYLPGNERRLSDDVRVAKARAAYWLRRYDVVSEGDVDGAVDADVLLAAANAAFRQSQRDPVAGTAAVQRLDGVLQAYASAMKATTSDALASVALAKEAAYNYEFVVRLRDQLASNPRGRAAAGAGRDGPRMAGDLPAGPTIHGGPGGPPPDTRMEELQTIMPMEYGDREAQPEPTPGARRERKG